MSGAWAGFGGFLFLVLSPLILLGIEGIHAELRLRSEGVVVDGQVLAQRDGDVRYRFSVDGRRYTHTSGSRGDSLWTSLDSEAEARARRSGIVRVLYLPSDPHVNRALRAGGMPLGDPLAAVCVFGPLAVLGVVLVALGLVRRREGVPRSF
ncbi:MAG: DUF3592 domain-containing protein [Sandaracinus sp.]|nr:DUF3592 domain-containing protein [Sandaracinus sp.]MCB9612052.1 DUF3592 domain-containing protein [Sandaracinus sp.]MCB9633140.1 DUF3592 domain-containing protein [Sandaracinus sp.]